jgi:hypothetical protein
MMGGSCCARTSLSENSWNHLQNYEHADNSNGQTAHRGSHIRRFIAAFFSA